MRDNPESNTYGTNGVWAEAGEAPANPLEGARCVGLHSEINFFPLTESEAVEAIEFCNGCSITEACLAYAVSNDEKNGVWGGRLFRREAVDKSDQTCRRGHYFTPENTYVSPGGVSFCRKCREVRQRASKK